MICHSCSGGVFHNDGLATVFGVSDVFLMDDAMLYGTDWVFLLLVLFFFYTIVLSKSDIPTVYFLG